MIQNQTPGHRKHIFKKLQSMISITWNTYLVGRQWRFCLEKLRISGFLYLYCGIITGSNKIFFLLRAPVKSMYLRQMTSNVNSWNVTFLKKKTMEKLPSLNLPKRLSMSYYYTEQTTPLKKLDYPCIPDSDIAIMCTSKQMLILVVPFDL